MLNFIYSTKKEKGGDIIDKDFKFRRSAMDMEE